MIKSTFNSVSFLKAVVPSYVFPLLSAAIPAYFLNKPDLLRASYTTIAVPSLMATIIGYVLLWQFQKRQIFIVNRFVMALVLGVMMFLLALSIIYIVRLEIGTWNILISAFLGAVIIAITKPLHKTIEK